MNELCKEIFDKLPSSKANEAVVSKYLKKLDGEEEQSLFNGAIRLMSAYIAAPGFNKNYQLDTLAKDDDVKPINILIRKYSKSISKIMDTFEEYYALKERTNFWTFFNNRLDLPTNWQKK